MHAQIYFMHAAWANQIAANKWKEPITNLYSRLSYVIVETSLCDNGGDIASMIEFYKTFNW